jgi:acid phosphatase family membrane protein YuiD
MFIKELFNNQALIGALIGWTIAQTVKVPLEYLRTKRWNWVLLFRTGGMPSSHAALVAGVAHGIGLRDGFDSTVFAIAAVLAIVVIYDATGIRRQAGKHATLINAMMQDLASGHPLKQELLREVLGHTPLEALAGFLLGLASAQLTWMLWK